MKRKINMNRIKLTPYEKRLEAEIERGEWVPVSDEEFQRIKEALDRRKKNKVLNIRINGEDLHQLKQKAKKLGVKYQTFITEILHRVARS